MPTEGREGEFFFFYSLRAQVSFISWRPSNVNQLPGEVGLWSKEQQASIHSRHTTCHGPGWISEGTQTFQSVGRSWNLLQDVYWTYNLWREGSLFSDLLPSWCKNMIFSDVEREVASFKVNASRVIKHGTCVWHYSLFFFQGATCLRSSEHWRCYKFLPFEVQNTIATFSAAAFNAHQLVFPCKDDKLVVNETEKNGANVRR